MKKADYHIFFDLDHTLWDFERCSKETLLELFEEYRIDALGGLQAKDFLSAFGIVNRELWVRYDRNEIDKEQIRQQRFHFIFSRLGVTTPDFAPALGEAYLSRCPQKPHLLPHGREILEQLHGKYPLHIITNGFEDVQYTKMLSSGIRHYFQTISTSESAGCKKPDPRMFQVAMQLAGAQPEQSIMIGDNLRNDILAAQQAGMRTIYYNPEGESHQANPWSEVSCLSAIPSLLEA